MPGLDSHIKKGREQENNAQEAPRSYFVGVAKMFSPLRGTNSYITYYLLSHVFGFCKRSSCGSLEA